MACCQEMGVTSRSSRASAQGASAERLRASSALAQICRFGHQSFQRPDVQDSGAFRGAF